MIFCLGRESLILVRWSCALESIEVRHGVSKTFYDIWCIINISYVIFGFCILRFQVWVLKNPHLFNKWSKLFRDVKFWNGQTQNSVETLFLSERANTQLFRTSKIFEIGSLFVILEDFFYWSRKLKMFTRMWPWTVCICTMYDKHTHHAWSHTREHF